MVKVAEKAAIIVEWLRADLLRFDPLVLVPPLAPRWQMTHLWAEQRARLVLQRAPCSCVINELDVDLPVVEKKII